jgi:hypothetical protein
VALRRVHERRSLSNQGTVEALGHGEVVVGRVLAPALTSTLQIDLVVMAAIECCQRHSEPSVAGH